MKICPMCGASYDDASVFCSVDGAALRSLADGNDLIHTVIADHYLITRLLGEGGMGRVYLAKHIRLPQSWAIKVLDPALVRDTGALARFNQEAASASRIENRHVARVIDFGETSDGLLYLAMEYVDGEALSKLIEREGPLDPARTTEITSQVAEALTAAHDLGIVHRDLKPDNIMIGRGRDDTDDAKVVDFGIAKAIHQDESEKVTKTGFAIGTPEYMSPEQLRAGEVDGRSDIYSLALVTFRMLTGKLPFPADTPQEAMFMRVTHPPRTLAEMHAEVEWPPALQAVIDRALARDPEDRFQSAADFARALRGAVMEGRAPATSAPAPRERDVAGPASTPRERDADAPAHVQPRRAPAFRGGLIAVGVVALVGLGGYFFVGRSAGKSAPGEARQDSTAAGAPASTAPAARTPVTTAPAATSPIGTTSVAAASDTLGGGAAGTVADPPAARDAGAATAHDKADQEGTSPPAAKAPPARNSNESAGASSSAANDRTNANSESGRGPRTGAVTDSRSSTRVRDSAGARVAPTSANSSMRARHELDDLEQIIELPTESNARRLLGIIPDALPKLASRTDTVEAWYYAVQANVLLNDLAAACDLIGRIGSDAKTTQFAGPLQFLSDTLRCQ